MFFDITVELLNIHEMFYTITVELMNIHEIKCKILNQAITRTSHDNLVRFSTVNSFHQYQLRFYKIKNLRYDL